MSFANLNLSPTLLKSLQQCGYHQPTPIQEQAIPHALNGKDLIATAQTGTGKTAAFVLPALQLLEAQTKQQSLPTILILAPVRELAQQITTAIQKYSQQARVNVVNILGGMPYHAQLRQLSRHNDIIVATPGRLIDYLKRDKINLSQIKMLVLDEADRMLDMGFITDVELIAQYIPKQRQTLLFTATLDQRVTKLAQKMLHQPVHIAIPAESIAADKIEQSAYFVDDMAHKNQLLIHLLANQNIYKAIIFCATKRLSEQMAYKLRDLGYAADALNGDIKQNKRNTILSNFRTGKLNLLIATDVAARGIDISDISHVINYDIPRTGEDYVHRIGRTARAGRDGIAISFIAHNEKSQLKIIERYINNSVAITTVAGLEPKNSAHSFSGEKRKSNRHKQHAGRRQESKRSGDKKHFRERDRDNARSGNREERRNYGDNRFRAKPAKSRDGQAKKTESSNHEHRPNRQDRFDAKNNSNNPNGFRKKFRGEQGNKTGSFNNNHERRSNRQDRSDAMNNSDNPSGFRKKFRNDQDNKTESFSNNHERRQNRQDRFGATNNSDNSNGFRKKFRGDQDRKTESSNNNHEHRSNRQDRFDAKDNSNNPNGFRKKFRGGSGHKTENHGNREESRTNNHYGYNEKKGSQTTGNRRRSQNSDMKNNEKSFQPKKSYQHDTASNTGENPLRRKKIQFSDMKFGDDKSMQRERDAE